MARSLFALSRLQSKPCGETSCPLAMRDLWAKAHLVCQRFDELMAHPNDPELREVLAERVADLRIAAKHAEPVMEVRLRA